MGGRVPRAKPPQPDFNGRQSFYSSGFIPFEGDDGNRFSVTVADDIEPGTYDYACLIHPPIVGQVVVTA